jgi:glycosyltransferase involved in cell wall biosynthesis
VEEAEAGGQHDLVTVVVPARNEEGSIQACIHSLVAQDWPWLEILVVDGCSEDSTLDIVSRVSKTDPRVRVLRNEHRVIPEALNLALAEASGRWLIRVDAHATVPPDYVRLAVEHLQTGRYGGVGGRKDGVGRTPAGKAIAAVMSSRFGVGGSTYHHGTSVRDVEHVPFGAYPVELLRAMGGWNPQLLVNQDFELDYRLRANGHRLLFDPRLRIDWESREDISALFGQYRRYGRGKVAVAVLHPGSLRPRHLAPPLLVAALVASFPIALRWPKAALAMSGPYALGLAIASVRTAGGLDSEARRYVPGAFLAMHVGWGIGFWAGAGRAIGGRLRRRSGG